MDKKGFSRNFRYPSAELRDQVRAAVKERGFRSEQAFLIAACEHEIREGANTEATEQFEARVAATLTNLAKQVQGLQTLAHAQVALTDVVLKYVITCVVEPPEDALTEMLYCLASHGWSLAFRSRSESSSLKKCRSRFEGDPCNAATVEAGVRGLSPALPRSSEARRLALPKVRAH